MFAGSELPSESDSWLVEISRWRESFDTVGVVLESVGKIISVESFHQHRNQNILVLTSVGECEYECEDFRLCLPSMCCSGAASFVGEWTGKCDVFELEALLLSRCSDKGSYRVELAELTWSDIEVWWEEPFNLGE